MVVGTLLLDPSVCSDQENTISLAFFVPGFSPGVMELEIWWAHHISNSPFLPVLSQLLGSSWPIEKIAATLERGLKNFLF